jgi:hypothetical protein
MTPSAAQRRISPCQGKSDAAAAAQRGSFVPFARLVAGEGRMRVTQWR